MMSVDAVRYMFSYMVLRMKFCVYVLERVY